LSIAVRPGRVENTGTNTPHHNTEGEESNSENGVVSLDLLCTLVSASAIAPEDGNTEDHGHTSDNKKKDLRPWTGTDSPWRKIASRRQLFCCIEDRKRRSEHGQDDEGACKVDASQKHLCRTNSSFDFLDNMLVTSQIRRG
jgi:hypothetical protein